MNLLDYGMNASSGMKITYCVFSSGLSNKLVEFDFNPTTGGGYTTTETASSFIAIMKDGIGKISY